MMVVDYKREFKSFYSSGGKQPVIVDIPQMQYLMFDGEGTPEGEDFQVAVRTMYTIAYILKFLIYNQRQINYKVMPLEVKWRLDRENKKFNWTMLIMQPDFISKEDYVNAIGEAKVKQKTGRFERLRFDLAENGKFVQMFHQGPYSRMNDTLKIMKEYAGKQGMDCENDTHDIYLNDARRTKPENLKTVMRLKIIENSE